MADLQELVRQCQAERQAFYRQGERLSPACLALFRRAFAGDQLAWEAIFTQIFHEELHRWVTAAGNVRHFTPADVEEALQETRSAFAHYAPHAPTLLDSGDLDPVIAYLKKCVMTGVGRVGRKLQPLTNVALTEIAGEEEGEASETQEQPSRKFATPAERSFTESLDNVRVILDELAKILQTDLERHIAQECFLNGTPPREFIVDYGALLAGDTEKQKLATLNQALKRIRLRAEKSPTFQTWQSARRKTDAAAFLSYSEADVSRVGEVEMPNTDPCAFDEAALLDYIQGNAEAELVTAIERSPACVAAAQRFAAEIALVTALLRLETCPDVAMLIDYHAKQLPSAQQLVVRKHVQGCAQCQIEIAMFDAIAHVSFQEEPSRLRRLFEAFFLPPTLSSVPVRGALPSVHYRTQIRVPAIDLFIFTQKANGKARTWTMRGELRTEEGLQFTQVEQIMLQTADDPDATASTEPALLQTTLDADGMFLFRGLEAGLYTLQVFTAKEEILIRALRVGDES